MKRIAVRVMAMVGACGSLTAVLADEAPSAVIAPAPGRYVVSPDDSWVHILVFRGGVLKGLGHNHVVSSSGIDGVVDVSKPLSGSRVSLDFSPESFTVDDPGLRRAEGERFGKPLSADDIAATRENMLGPRLLDAARSPVIRLRSTDISGNVPNLEIAVDLTIRGVTQQLIFPVEVTTLGNTLTVAGSRRVTHEELGLKPFRAALGALRVKNELLMKYSIVASRQPRQTLNRGHRE